MGAANKSLTGGTHTRRATSATRAVGSPLSGKNKIRVVTGRGVLDTHAWP